MTNDVRSVYDVLAGIDAAVIAVHEKPDGDACGAAVSCALLVQSMGKKFRIADRNAFPAQYDFLIAQLNDTCSDADTMIILDSGTIDRLDASTSSGISGKKIINIDHHEDNTLFGSANLVVKSASSTCEIVFSIAQCFSGELPNAFYEAVYTGIMTDTGNFAFSNATAETFEVASAIMRRLGDPSSLYRRIWASFSPSVMQAYGRILSRILVFNNNKLVVSYISLTDCNELGISYKDIEGVTNLLGSVKNAEVWALIKETAPDVSRVSLRSAGNRSVADFAREHEGGGHKFAAGATLYGTCEDIKRQLKEYWSDL